MIRNGLRSISTSSLFVLIIRLPSVQIKTFLDISLIPFYIAFNFTGVFSVYSLKQYCDSILYVEWKS